MSSVETGQMSAVETGQMTAAETSVLSQRATQCTGTTLGKRYLRVYPAAAVACFRLGGVNPPSGGRKKKIEWARPVPKAPEEPWDSRGPILRTWRPFSTHFGSFLGIWAGLLYLRLQHWYSTSAFNIGIQHRHSTSTFNFGVQHRHSTSALNNGIPHWHSTLSSAFKIGIAIRHWHSTLVFGSHHRRLTLALAFKITIKHWHSALVFNSGIQH